jgi:hypothetical protein
MKWLLSCVVIGVLLLVPHAVQACPACSEAIANSSEDEDGPSNFPRAMNQSIYLMVSVPYLTLGVVSFLIYRGCQKNAQYLASLERTSDAAPPI